MSSHGPLQHHFRDLRQQYEASALGMWLFLVTEILFFGGLFAGYTVYRTMYPEAFRIASLHLNAVIGAGNTLVLLGSSLTMVLAVNEARKGDNAKVIRYVLWTLLLGGLFLGVKVFEYHEKWAHHLIPGKSFYLAEYPGAGSQLFFSFYFAMTGLHALHMIIGAGLLIQLIVKAKKNLFTPAYNTPVDMVGLYWHFVDIIWVFLFPLLYLIERH